MAFPIRDRVLRVTLSQSRVAKDPIEPLTFPPQPSLNYEGPERRLGPYELPANP